LRPHCNSATLGRERQVAIGSAIAELAIVRNAIFAAIAAPVLLALTGMGTY